MKTVQNLMEQLERIKGISSIISLKIEMEGKEKNQ